MKVYLNGYKDHWISPITIVDYMFFWTAWSKCSRNKWIVEDKDWVDSPEWADKLAKRLTWVSNIIKWVWGLFDHEIRYVKIDRYDTWSMDHTLAYIIVPMLKQLREDKHGYPLTKDEDAPEEFSSKNNPADDEYSWDNGAEARWNWILNEMIWAFEQKLDDDAENQFFDHTESNKETDFNLSLKKLKVDREGLTKYHDRMENGFRLFGRYYQALWD
jgi:hypothetical protein